LWSITILQQPQMQRQLIIKQNNIKKEDPPD
jgi:hypothetical protein